MNIKQAFQPDKDREESLAAVDELAEENPVDASTAKAAADEWRNNPPVEEFEQLLDAKEEE